MNPQFDIHTFRPDAVDDIAQFLGSEYPQGEIADVKYLEWEYLNNPSGKAIVTTARKDKKITSQYALLPVQVHHQGKILSGTLSLNTLTGKEYRGKGLFKTTALDAFGYCARNGFILTYGVPNKSSFPGFVKYLKFSHTGNLVFMGKMLRPSNVFASFISRNKSKKGEAIRFDLDYALLNKYPVTRLNFPADENRYKDFLNRWSSGDLYSIHRSPDYLSWRYFQNPLREYQLFKLNVNGAIKAIVVIRSMHLYGMRVCLIMDLLSNDESSSLQLLDAVSVQAKKNQLDLIIAVAASKKGIQFNHFKASGFRSVPDFLLPQQLPFIIRMHQDDENISSLSDLNNWHFSFGDYDVF